MNLQNLEKDLENLRSSANDKRKKFSKRKIFYNFY